MSWAALPIALAGVLASCVASGKFTVRPTPPKTPVATEVPAASLWALLINGGGSKERNYQSHLLHVRTMFDYLKRLGVPRDQIAVFTSDGNDPEADLAVRDVQTNPNFWLIAALAVGRRLGENVRFENSAIEGIALRPATKEALARWMSTHNADLRSGDTLLVYVTDHGAKNSKDLDNNRIVLWGEQWSVEEFRRFLSAVPTGVRIVTVMSQCFSGSFANIAFEAGGNGGIEGNTCGFFSSSAARQAYGCYPENLGKDNVGHSFRFLEALEATGNTVLAHERTLVADRTPDVPNRTSDLALRKLLEAHAQQNGQSLRDYVDGLLNGQKNVRKIYPVLFRQIDAIAHVYGNPAPRNLQELLQNSRSIPQMARQLKSYARRWQATLADLERANFERFLSAHPEWGARVTAKSLDKIDEAGKRRLARALLAELLAHTKADSSTMNRLDRLRDTAARAAKAAYRMEVRHAASLRMQELLVRAAAHIDLERNGDDDTRHRQYALAKCENLDLGAVRAGHGPRVAVDSRGPSRKAEHAFPPLADEVALLDSIRPGWLGIQFGQPPKSLRQQHRLNKGAVEVRAVVPGSPAERAGLVRNDVIVGTTDGVFRERNQIREWAMTTPPGHSRTLLVLRNGVTMKVAVQIGAAPL